MAEDAANFLLQLVKTHLSAHIDLISGEKEELNKLQTDVETMRECWPSRKSPKEYERRVRDALHEADDIVDECRTRAALNKSQLFKNKYLSKTHARLAEQVKSFRENTIKSLLDEFHSLPTPQPSPSTPPITTDQPNGEIIITHPSIYNGASSQGEASTSQSLVNENLIEQERDNAPLRVQASRVRNLAIALGAIFNWCHSVPTDPRPAPVREPHPRFPVECVSKRAPAPCASLPHPTPVCEPQPVGSGQARITITHQSEYDGASAQGVTSASQSHVNGNLIEQETCMKRGSVVGFDEKANAIISLLTKTSSELQVITITGMLGLGKSTLARKVYESKRHRDDFSKVIWVDVTQKFDKRKVFLSILRSLAKEGILPGTSDDALEKVIKSYLENQKFLLIFDDVCNIEDWRAIETALPKGNSRGRVLITSRIESVGVMANWNYKLEVLDRSKSWDLLQLQVFDNLNTCPSELDGSGRTIAKQCGGLPHAIVVIAGVLLKIRSTSTGVNETRIQWENVANSVSEHLNDINGLTENLVALSYNELPLDLKYCFLYLGVFPEESPIPIRRLIRLWIAEGFIWRKGNKTLEEVAKENLDELIDRNLVINNFKPDGYIKTCRLHPLIRKFCKKQASPENHNLFQEMETSSDGNFNPPISEIQNRRRICIHSRIKDFLETNPQGPRVHSLLCSAKEATSLPANTSLIPRHFNRLRVVDVTPIKLTKFPSRLDKLIHLRYIALSAHSDAAGNVLWNLPKKISRLWNLQSITIETNSRTFEIKANLWKMMHLRHLKTKAAIILRKKLKGQAGEQLQSVSRLSTQCCTEDVFNKAKNIQKLGICGDLNTIMKVSCLRELHLLRKLKLVHDVYPKEASEKPLSRLPDNDVFPLNLRILHLSGTFLTWNRIRTLEKLDGLEVLKLKNSAFTGKHWLAEEGCFASLEILLIADTKLKVWTAKDSYFPKLKCLILKDCKQLDEIPFGSTENLQILHVENVSESAVGSARRIAEIRRGLKLIIPDNGGSASNI